MTSETPWPLRLDGTPKTMGEMTHEEQRAQFIAAIDRLKPGFAGLGVKLSAPSALNTRTLSAMAQSLGDGGPNS